MAGITHADARKWADDGAGDAAATAKRMKMKRRPRTAEREWQAFIQMPLRLSVASFKRLIKH